MRDYMKHTILAASAALTVALAANAVLPDQDKTAGQPLSLSTKSGPQTNVPLGELGPNRTVTTTTTAPPPTTAAPAPKRPPVTRAARSRPTPVTGGDVWAALARCESGGDPAKNTGNGYYGAFQFSLRTWQSVGGTGYPHQHSYGEQLKRAQILQARSGWGQWPSCSRKLGLR